KLADAQRAARPPKGDPMQELALARLVRPRVIDTAGGSDEPIRIEDAVERRIERRDERLLFVVGPPGAGKRTAIEYLRLTFAARDEVSFGDPPGAERNAPREVRVSAQREPSADLPRCRLELVPWGRDEWIEYLLARHRAACASVMARVEGRE